MQRALRTPRKNFGACSRRHTYNKHTAGRQADGGQTAGRREVDMQTTGRQHADEMQRGRQPGNRHTAGRQQTDGRQAHSRRTRQAVGRQTARRQTAGIGGARVQTKHCKPMLFLEFSQDSKNRTPALQQASRGRSPVTIPQTIHRPSSTQWGALPSTYQITTITVMAVTIAPHVALLPPQSRWARLDRRRKRHYIDNGETRRQVDHAFHLDVLLNSLLSLVYKPPAVFIN